MSADAVWESARGGRLVPWEEPARDGFQVKTLMRQDLRMRLAEDMGRAFGADGSRHMIFAAGSPAVRAQGAEAVRQDVERRTIDDTALAGHLDGSAHPADGTPS